MDDLSEYIKQNLQYNPKTGIIVRNDRKSSNGSLDKDGYLILKIKGKQFKAHRIAWFLFYGEFPKNNIDHINRNRLDNRIKNLRDVSQQQNVYNTNRTPNKDTGVVGVYIDKSTKGLKKIYTFKKNGKTYRFRTLDEAIKKRTEIYENTI